MDGLASPHRHLGHGAKPAQKQYAAIARAIAEFTPVYMCANQADYANCKAVFEDDENVTVIEMTTDDAWFRDTAATYVINGKGEKRANHWHFNAYGGLIDGLVLPVGQGRADRSQDRRALRLPPLSSR